jgi:hypothetical protein
MSDYLLQEPRSELKARDDLFRSGLKQARNLVNAARAFRSIPSYHAELLDVAGEMRRFAVRRRNGRSLRERGGVAFSESSVDASHSK